MKSSKLVWALCAIMMAAAPIAHANPAEDAQRAAQEEAQRAAQEAAQRAQEEAQRQAQEEAQREAQEEAQRQAQEQAQREAQEQAQRQAQEEAQREAQRQAQEEAQREAQRQAQEEAQRQAQQHQQPAAPAPQAPAPQAPAPRAPAPQAPAPRVPAPQAPAPRVPAPQAPAPRVPAPQAPAPRVPAPQAPAQQSAARRAAQLPALRQAHRLPAPNPRSQYVSEQRRAQRQATVSKRKTQVRQARAKIPAAVVQAKLARLDASRAAYGKLLSARGIVIRRDQNGIRNPSFWVRTYNNWWLNDLNQPDPSLIDDQIVWFEDMPVLSDSGVLAYTDVETVALNLEVLTEQIYETMDQIAPIDNEYGMRLRKVLAQLVDAAADYDDSVLVNEDFDDTLYDLFYLAAATSRAEKTLNGYSQEPLVDGQMQTLRYWVNELLYTYRQQY